MTTGPIGNDSAGIQPQPPQAEARQEVQREEQQQRQAEQETATLQNTETAENRPDPNSRVGSVINTQV